MNLGISLDSSGGRSGVDMSGDPSAAGGTTVPPAGAAFGQLMAKAMQQHEQAEQRPGASSDAPPHLQEGMAQPGTASDSGATEDTMNKVQLQGSAPALTDSASPSWLDMALASVQHICVGPNIQAITASTPAPDTTSLTAFAQQQGLDADAIAWLMNPAGQSLAGSAMAGKMPGTPIETASSALGAQGALPALSAGVSGPVSAPSSKLAGSATAAGMLASLFAQQSAKTATAPALPANALPPAVAPQPGAPTAAGLAANASADALASFATTTGPTDAATPVTAGLTLSALGSGLAATFTPQAKAQTPSPADTLPGAAELASQGLGQLRWAGLRLNAANAAKPASPNTPATTTATPWAQSTLDLSAAMGAVLGSAGLTPGSSDVAEGPNAGDTQARVDGAPSASIGLLPSPTRQDGASHSARTPDAQAGATGTAAPSSDQMQQLSEKMADAVGQRILREIERGQWNLRLMLKPAHLGHIEVEMRLHAGQLDATFTAPQAATRELLQDGLDRLKVNLSLAGMDVANLDVKNGQNRQNDGDSTAGRRPSAPQTGKQETPETATAPTVESRPRPGRADGWDVTV